MQSVSQLGSYMLLPERLFVHCGTVLTLRSYGKHYDYLDERSQYEFCAMYMAPKVARFRHYHIIPAIVFPLEFLGSLRKISNVSITLARLFIGAGENHLTGCPRPRKCSRLSSSRCYGALFFLAVIFCFRFICTSKQKRKTKKPMLSRWSPTWRWSMTLFPSELQAASRAQLEWCDTGHGLPSVQSERGKKKQRWQ